ncbi:hypothetical protein DL96DRAFT_1561256 [Flagelloscypha sp. PMI_526]|nr:hypothetical protein DL96DRAFT_1561256 [Flagelloscypha sp. PMI_526]
MTLLHSSLNVPCVRHESSFFDDGNFKFGVLFSGQVVIYQLHKSMMLSQGGLFATFLQGLLPFTDSQDFGVSLPMDQDVPSIPLGQADITLTDFDALLLSIYGSINLNEAWQRSNNNTSHLVSLLKVSTFFDMAQFRTFAVDRLHELSPSLLSSLYKFYLGRTYHILEWLAPTFADILGDRTLHFARLTQVELQWLGSAATYLAFYETQLELLQKMTAACPPAYAASSGCTTISACSSAWTKEWTSTIAFNINHPTSTDWRVGHPLLFQIACLEKVKGMCSDCLEETKYKTSSDGTLTRRPQLLKSRIIWMVEHGLNGNKSAIELWDNAKLAVTEPHALFI